MARGMRFDDPNLPAEEEEEECADDDEAECDPSTPVVPCTSTTVRLPKGIVTSIHDEGD